MAKKTMQTDPETKNVASGVPEPVRSPRATAGPCPKSALHTQTRIYKTKGTVRHAVCDECGETWKVTAERADPDKQYLADLAEALAEAATVTTGEKDVICLEAKLRNDIVKKLREIAGR